MTLKISLYEALCGFEREFTYLDSVKHLIKSKPGDIINPGSIKTVIYMGLPIFTNPALNGNLFIHFEIEFPKSLSTQQIEQVQVTLSATKPKPCGQFTLENTHECIQFDKKHINENTNAKSDNVYNSDEEQGGGQQGGEKVQCQNM